MVRFCCFVLKKSDRVEQEPRIRSPLSENLSHHDLFPKSPLLYTNPSTVISPHALPPLKFHSGLLQSITPLVNENQTDENESMDSVSDNMDTNSDDDGEVDSDLRCDGVGFEGRNLGLCSEEEEESLGFRSRNVKLNKGSMSDLKVELPDGGNRLFNDGNLGTGGGGGGGGSLRVLSTGRAGGGGSRISSLLRERVQLRNAQVRVV